VRAEIVAVGTELLLGQIVDSNSAWMGEKLALAGIDCHYQTRVGDNVDRVVLAMRAALARSEAVIVCGGLGPTQDDLTREAIAEVMGTTLVRDEAIAARIAEMFASRGRQMPQSNLQQADVPAGATAIGQTRGTAPGLICPVGHKVLYAVPGVPHEMREMVERAVLPDLKRRAAERGEQAVIVSRTLRTWGLSESLLAEIIAPRYEALDRATGPAPTIAFLASGIEGMKLRVTAKAASAEEAAAAVAAEEAELRALLGEVVFGADDETMEFAVAAQLLRTGRTLAVAESLTGGLVASRLVAVEGASNWFRGAVVAYATDAKQSVLDLPADVPAVSAAAAEALAAGAARALGADVGLATTGVAGPTEQDGQPVGTVFVGMVIGDEAPTAVQLLLPGDRERIRQFSTISALDLLRRRLGAVP
jgi:nicotinamide-nucleotide amidase